MALAPSTNSNMEMTAQWVLSQDVPTDIVVDVGETSFALHKFMLVAKSNLFRKIIKESEGHEVNRINLSDIPGGAETFEKAAKFCYGINFEIAVENVAPLLCGAQFLQMFDDYSDWNLRRRTDNFLLQVGLSSFPAAVTVLKSCKSFFPFAEDLNIVERCVNFITLKACDEESKIQNWAEEISVLDINSLERIISAMTTKGAKISTIAMVLIKYSEQWLLQNPGKYLDPTHQTHQCKLFESIVALISRSEDKFVFPIHFLCRLLQSGILLETAVSCRDQLEKRISAIIERASVDDILMLSFSHRGSEKVLNLDSVIRIFSLSFHENNRNRSIAIGKTLDLYLAHIAAYPELTISVFNEIAILAPEGVRAVHDFLYRAIDTFLKAHPGLEELEREKACSSMDPLRLSYDARVHASQNKRLPVQVVLHALYYDQLKLRSVAEISPRRKSINFTAQGAEEKEDTDSSLSAFRARKSQVQMDVSLVRENEALRSELRAMKTCISDMQHGGNHGASSSSLAISKKAGKKLGFFSSIGKKIGRLNPFRHGSKDASQIEFAIGNSKPKKRRFSIS